MLRPGILRTSLVAILVSCVLVCPECWLGALAASFLGIDHQGELACACACCVHAGTAAPRSTDSSVCEHLEHDEDCCPSETRAAELAQETRTPSMGEHAALPGEHGPSSPASCICQGAIPPASVLTAGLAPRDFLWLALPAEPVYGWIAGSADHPPGDAVEALPSSSGRALRLALGSLLI